ncbi:MAG TPA: BACON domain-containing protein [Vicinamibacteria bacterium]|nr:BACON domain-containing protein [Vicinamibacteria bacterium]
MQTLFRDRVKSWVGPLDVHGVASGTAAGPAGSTIQYTTDQHVSGTLTLDVWDPLTGSWYGTLAGTITINEQAIITSACTITNTFSASTSADKDFLGKNLVFHLSLDVGSDTWSLWPSNQYVNGNEHSVVNCAGVITTSDATVPMTFMPIDMGLHFPFPTPPPFDLIGSQVKAEPTGGTAASNPVTYTFTYNLTATTYPCDPSFSAPSRDFSSRAGSGSATVDIGPSCPWTVTLPAPWVTVTSPLTGSGSGPGQVDFDVSANTSGADRSTTIGVGTATFTISQGEAGYFTVIPCRAIDTRNPNGPLGGPALQPSATRSFDVVASACGIPLAAQAISANVTVTAPTMPGYLTLFPEDAPKPVASSINFQTGQTRANNVVLALSNDGTASINVFNGSAGTVQFILDVNGYFQ